MSWTTFPDVYSAGLPRLAEWAATVDVTQADKAQRGVLLTIAREGLAYNLLLLKKVDSGDVVRWHELFGADWTAALDAAAQAGLLYVIDLRIYETLQPQQGGGLPRFTPSTVVVLVQDAATKALTPNSSAWRVAPTRPKIFSRQGSTTASAWLCTPCRRPRSRTGRPRHLDRSRLSRHIVTAAMQMTMFPIPLKSNPARRLLEPQSSYLIPFDDVLLLKWSVSRAADVDRECLAVPRAARPLYRRARVLRRRSDDHAAATRPHRVRLHGARAVGPVPRRRPAVEHLGRDGPLRGHLRRSGLSDRRGRPARSGARTTG